MRVGLVILPEHRWWVAAPKWEALERYGFDHGWTYDHLAWSPAVDGPWFGAVPTLTAAAMVTSRLRLGTFVASPDFRHPVSFARDLITIDDVSDGRLVLGVGAGREGFDATVLGNRPLRSKDRLSRLAEFLELLDTLLTQDRTTWSGDYYTAVDARSTPGGVQRPRLPFVIAANGRRAMRLAARFGQGWVTTGRPADEPEAWWRGVAERAALMAELMVVAGRDPARFDRYLSLDAAPVYSLSSVECFVDMVGRAAELGFTDVVAHWPRHDDPYAGHESVVEAIAADVLPGLPGRSAVV